MPFIAPILSVLVAFGAIFYTYFKVKYQYWKKKNVPYIEPRVPFGSFESSSAKFKSFPDNIVDAYNVARKNNWSYIGVYTLYRPVLVVNDLDLIKNIMTKDFNHFVDRGFYTNEKDQPISAHLFAIGGVKWRNLRTKFTPTFTSGKMRMMFQTLADCGVLLEDYLKEISDKKDGVDIKNLLGCFSTDIIGSVAFGIECNTIREPNSPFRVNSKKIFERSKIDALKMTAVNSIPNVARALGIVPFPRETAKFFTDIVQQTVEYREKNNIERKDFLQLLIDIKNNKEGSGNAGDGTNLTMDEIAAQSFVFFIAGFETSATTMTFALYELAAHQDVQGKVREEIHRVLKKHNGQISYDSLKEMEFMQQVIDETLRMYPPVPVLSRECVDEYKAPGFDLIIEKGIRVIIPAKGIHYDESVYPEPTVFNPDRFTADQKKSRHQYAHLPFGEGPRNCIGMRFGLMQTKVGLVSMLKNHKVTLNEKTRVPLKFSPYAFVPQVEGGIWLNIEKV